MRHTAIVALMTTALALPTAWAQSVPQQRVVFFDSASSVLHGPGRDVVEQVAASMKGFVGYVCISGHGGAGEPSDSEELSISERRAGVVRNYLVALGIEEDRIFVSARDDSMPTALAPSGMQEAQDRRAEIVLRNEPGCDNTQAMLGEQTQREGMETCKTVTSATSASRA